MALLTRIVFSVVSYISLMALSVVYIRVGLPLLDRLANQNGPFSSVGAPLRIMIPAIIAGLILGTTIFLIFGAVKEEKARNRASGQRRRPPPPPR